LADVWRAKYHGEWHFEVANGSFQSDGGEVLVFEVLPTKIVAFAKGHFSQTRDRS